MKKHYTEKDFIVMERGHLGEYGARGVRVTSFLISRIKERATFQAPQSG